MFKKVLIANRGEIALRIIRACKELSIPTVAIHSEADATTLYVKKADEACLIGPGPIEGYLNIYRIIDLAKQKGVDAIHPGYGFLAENPEFAQACQESGLTFIGPPAAAIRAMGDKVSARQKMKEIGVPIVPGLVEPIASLHDAASFADEIGYPVMLKASAGGGGRGLRICKEREELKKLFPIAQAEAKASFGKEAVYLEKYIHAPHHIEFQILADKQGNVIHLGERDCSIQRRHQKLIEIAPSLLLDERLRREMGEAAVAAARSVGYTSAGTIEFLVDSSRRYYFLEMNTRIQVEHTVTEEITGVDLVKEMIRIAAGQPISIPQEQVFLRGHAIECRINAEDPQKNFIPTPGKITAYYSPGGIGVRIDGNVYAGYVVPPYYDSLLAKLTVRARTWDGAVQRMRRALDEYVIRGVKTTIPFYKRIMEDPDFQTGHFDTTYIDSHLDKLNVAADYFRMDKMVAIAAAIAAHSKR
ncbi:MAG: acetyl-CoA carboxylase biotin carboxylase subunit [Candidatus Manganitrophus sp.]|nr:acetyl-CoA carboxylase biotin carboxylase subunit [Candidatus Manganitrophus sp.]MDC4225081.1 acetyl-CoA carboxylase biotin carboxylase subunit [Candidatus Manganitrophus sp.]WDT71662.1 MAG: acetyl-CoA carboxylase biotin carboxylase subunit [Candidatus Manganitrophus sp.]WDT80985.1 MAG: acetyl-CoA carboxylase biotin carboxylase subunit [Candidatus Manganitrophus sp.]